MSDMEKNRSLLDISKRIMNESVEESENQLDESFENLLLEGGDRDAKIIKTLVHGKWAGSNKEQMKAVQLLKGLSASETEESNDFMKYLDKAASEYKPGSGMGMGKGGGKPGYNKRKVDSNNPQKGMGKIDRRSGLDD